MTDKEYETDQNLIRSNGEKAWSPSGRAFADLRSTSHDSRIKKIFGNGPPFAASFIDAVNEDYNWILERPHLVFELKAAKRILQALEKVPNDHDAQDLLRRMKVDPTSRNEPCLVCPVWRNNRELMMMDAARKRYVFPRVRHELYFVTLIFSFSENIYELADAYCDAHQVMKGVISDLSKKRKGVMITGCLEPDLVSADELRGDSSKMRMMQQFDKPVPEAGGWILTGHFFVRVPHEEILKDILYANFPRQGWAPVVMERIYGDGELEHHLMNILGYAGKYPKPLFDTDTRGEGLCRANDRIRSMRAAFAGPEFNIKPSDKQSFDIDAAIVQWAKFIDGMDEKMIYYSVESVHAQKWYSDSEMAWLRQTDDDLYSDGRHRIEIHRDTGPFSERIIDSKFRGRFRSLRSRPLVRDYDWEDMTDCSGLDPTLYQHDFLAWMFKK